MIYSHKQRLIFIHIHRTGGTAISNLLLSAAKDTAMYLSEHEHARTAGLRMLKSHPDYRCFALVRNPWDRLFSWYKHIKQAALEPNTATKQAFADFLEEYAACPPAGFALCQLHYITDAEGKEYTTHLGRFEQLETEVKRIFSQLQLPPPALAHLNASNAADYRRFYSEQSHDLVATQCKPDIVRFGYAFDGELNM